MHFIFQSSSDDTSDNVGTMVPDSDQTLVRSSGDTAGNGGGSTADNGTMIQHATLVPESHQQQQKTLSDLESDLGTMVINEDDDEDEDTMKRKLQHMHA